MSHSESGAWNRLQELSARSTDLHLQDLIGEPGRIENYTASAAGLYVDFSKHLVDDDIRSALTRFAEEAGILDRARQMYAGEPVNATEHRAALHMAMRKPSPDLDSGITDQILAARAKLKTVSDSIRQGSWSDTVITDVINIGIGGSDLGPHMVYSALREFADGPRCHFISNVDGAELLTLLDSLDPATTLPVISSKTFTTSETLRNVHTTLAWLSDRLNLAQPEERCIAVTAYPENARTFGIPADQILTFPESIGGRYSLWSSIGLPVCIAIGFDGFSDLLSGAAAMDDHFLTAPPDRNIPLTMGLFTVWYNNFLGAQSHAVIPYCQRLRLLIDHLQQLEMESLGKSVALSGDSVEVDTGPVIWGQTGTNGQHAFFQLLHQGTRLIPVDFIGVVKDALSNNDHHRLLLANMIAQSEALMLGTSDNDPHKGVPGNRPSTTILLDELSPTTLGALIALYEHRVFTQAAIWNINPFDQFGVELGKTLSGSILDGSGEHDPSTLDLMKRTGF